MSDTYTTKVPVTTVSSGNEPQRIVPPRTKVRHDKNEERTALYVIEGGDLSGHIIAVPHRQKSAILEPV